MKYVLSEKGKIVRFEELNRGELFLTAAGRELYITARSSSASARDQNFAVLLGVPQGRKIEHVGLLVDFLPTVEVIPVELVEPLQIRYAEIE